ncbi:MAG: protein sphX, partial [Nitrosomonas sp.]|nr:protein sphX [Nitrosomonas sp.]
FYMQHAQQLVEEVRYFPLKKEFYDFNIKHLQNKTLGTVFGGEAGMGMAIEDLYKRERVQ